MPGLDLSQRIASAYFRLRLGMGILALTFPIILYAGGRIFAGMPLQQSMSAYYHANDGYMRDWFVGFLFALGIMLVLYRGFSTAEDVALNAAGALAVGVAVFPMAWPDSHFDGTILPGTHWSIHGTCAVLFFLCIAYVCVFHATDTLGALNPDETNDKQYNKFRIAYKTLGIAMVVCPIVAAAISTFYTEAAGVFVFSIFWLIKSRELSITHLDEAAALGKVKLVKDVVKPSALAAHRGESIRVDDHDPSASDVAWGRVSVRRVPSKTLD